MPNSFLQNFSCLRRSLLLRRRAGCSLKLRRRIKMRVKKQKRHRRAVRFYAACFGFREPYKVLCDGTFVHHLLVNQITPADTALVNTLGAAVKVFTTRCAVEELKSVLGASYSESLHAASMLSTARCHHEKRRSAVDCITEVIGENNPEHFFVATQDVDLRKKLQQIPGVPVIYALRNALFLERPSTLQQQFAKSAEEARSHMTDIEYKELNIMKKRKLSDEGAVDASNASEEEEGHGLEVQNMKTSVKRKRNRSDFKDKVQFKRKKAKNPNPLSVKKKKKKPAEPQKETKKNDDGTAGSKRKRKRTRKPKGKGNSIGEGGSG